MYTVYIVKGKIKTEKGKNMYTCDKWFILWLVRYEWDFLNGLRGNRGYT